MAEVLPPNPFWRYEVVTSVKLSTGRQIVYVTSRHWRRIEADQHAAEMSSVLTRVDGSRWLAGAEVRTRTVEPWHVSAYLLTLFILAIYMRITGWEFPTWVRVLLWCVVAAGVMSVVRKARRHA